MKREGREIAGVLASDYQIAQVVDRAGAALRRKARRDSPRRFRGANGALRFRGLGDPAKPHPAAAGEGWARSVSPPTGLESFPKASQGFRPGLSYAAPVGATVYRRTRRRTFCDDSIVESAGREGRHDAICEGPRAAHEQRERALGYMVTRRITRDGERHRLPK